jgi:hypothetical protein
VAGKIIYQRGMEEAPENGKESSHSAHTNEMNECMNESYFYAILANLLQFFSTTNIVMWDLTEKIKTKIIM